MLSPPETCRRELSILHVEDDVLDADLIGYALLHVQIPLRIQVVGDGASFQKALGSAKPDLILSDSGLPDLDGVSALALAKREHPVTPFIFCSGHVTEEKRAALLGRGATDCISKDDLPRLITRIRALFASSAEPASHCD